MKFELPDEYYDIEEATRRLLADKAGATVLRALWEGQAPAGPWDDLFEMGVATMTVPIESGGGGLPLTAATLVVEELGRFAVSQPVADTLAVACPVLARHRDDPSARRLLDAIGAGDGVVSIQNGWSASASWAAEALAVLVIDGDELVICERPAAGHLRAAVGIDPSRRLGQVDRQAETARLKEGAPGEVARVHALVAAAGTLSGLTDAVISQAVEYAKLRSQFDRPIGSFQAIKHLLADAYARWEYCRRYVWYASWLVEAGVPEATVVASRAKALLGDVAIAASRAAFQVFGGVAYTWESDLHLWMKRIQAIDAAYGTSESLWRQAAATADIGPMEL